MSRGRSEAAAVRLPEWTAILASRLREVRAARGESLAVVSAATGVSASFLSVLEQGKTDVSLGRLLPLLEHYHLSLGEIFAPQAPVEPVVRADDRRYLFSAAPGVDLFLASASPRGPFVPLVARYAADADMTDWSDHPGEEFVFVLAGRLRIQFKQGGSVLLAVGDSMMFSSRTPHRISAAGGEHAEALIVTTESHPRAPHPPSR